MGASLNRKGKWTWHKTECLPQKKSFDSHLTYYIELGRASNSVISEMGKFKEYIPIFSIYFNVFGVSVHIVFYVLVFSNHIHWYILSMTSLTKSHQLQFVLLGKFKFNFKISLGCFLSQSWFSHLLRVVWWYEGKCYCNTWFLFWIG